MESLYVVPAHGGGMLFFEEQMSLGNAPLGLSLLFLTAMLYSVVIGTVCTHHATIPEVPAEVVVPWILSQKGEAVPIEPPEIVEAVRKGAKATLDSLAK